MYIFVGRPQSSGYRQQTPIQKVGSEDDIVTRWSHGETNKNLNVDGNYGKFQENNGDDRGRDPYGKGSGTQTNDWVNDGRNRGGNGGGDGGEDGNGGNNGGNGPEKPICWDAFPHSCF